MKRTLLFLAVGGLALCTQTASVRASGNTTTLPPLYDAGNINAVGAMVIVIHNSPKSPVKDSESNKSKDKDSYSVGDTIVFSSPLYSTKDLATPGATLYGESTVLKGGTFANMLSMLHFDVVFTNGDHITGQGIVNWTGTEDAAITGGTGAYEGARGTMHHSKGADNLVTYNIVIKR